MYDPYEIYALKFAGPFERPEAFLVWLQDWDSRQSIYYYIWALKPAAGNGDVVLIDAGVAPDVAKERKLAGYESPADVLGRLGIAAEAVRHLILTHLHWDHMSGAKLFWQATFYVQTTEYRFWIEDPIGRWPPIRALSHDESRNFLISLREEERLVLVNGDEEILPGVKCLLAPGHTPGLQAVAVPTARGMAVLGSDCGHLFRNYDEVWPSSLIVDLPAWLRSFDKLRKAASETGLLFPGHDAAMLTSFPAVADGVTRLA